MTGFCHDMATATSARAQHPATEGSDYDVCLMIDNWFIHGHAIVSADDRIAADDGTVPQPLRNDADWSRFQAALDAAAVTVLGRRGHEANPNDKRRNRLVLSSSARGIEERRDGWWWNPAEASLAEALARSRAGWRCGRRRRRTPRLRPLPRRRFRCVRPRPRRRCPIADRRSRFFGGCRGAIGRHGPGPPWPRRRTARNSGRRRERLPRRLATSYRPSVSLTATASCFSENGFGRKWNFSPSGRFLRKASSA